MIDETAAEIEAMRTHSSSEVAIKAAEALHTLTTRDRSTVSEFKRDLEHNIGVLRRANPSHATLETALREIEDAVLDTDHTSVTGAIDALSETIDTVTERIQTAKQDAASNAVSLFSDGDTILTHDFSTTVMTAIREAAEQNISLQIYVTEARPRYLGRKTARELGKIDSVDATLIVDSAAGSYVDECDYVLTGMTCVVNDQLYNRVGTFPIAATAAQVDTPFYVSGASTKVIESGFVFENDYRDASEVLREPAEGFSIENPSYDATPIELVDRIITEKKIFSP